MKLLEPISKLDNSLNQFSKVAAAIADCDEHHEVSPLFLVGFMDELRLAKALDQIQQEYIRVLNSKRRLQIKIEVLKSLEQKVRGGEDLVRPPHLDVTSRCAR